jgi:hypothetical protein
VVIGTHCIGSYKYNNDHDHDGPSRYIKQVHNSRIEKVVMSEIEIGLSFMVPEHVYQLKMICLKGT